MYSRGKPSRSEKKNSKKIFNILKHGVHHVYNMELMSFRRERKRNVEKKQINKDLQRKYNGVLYSTCNCLPCAEEECCTYIEDQVGGSLNKLMRWQIFSWLVGLVQLEAPPLHMGTKSNQKVLILYDNIGQKSGQVGSNCDKAMVP